MVVFGCDMPCYHPLKAYRGVDRKIVFDHSQAIGPELTLPCGQCIGCRLERSRQWAVRLMHESQMHEDSCFLTLTYSPEKLPADGSVNVDHFQRFMKRLRQRVGVPLRYFHCGEYGEKFARPHYHCILFGYSFPDRRFFSFAGECQLFISPLLDDVWGYGHCVVGDVTFDSAAYVARYVTKKVTGERADDHYLRLDESSGELVKVAPEYVTMSRRPGIACGWFRKFKNEVFPDDEVIARGISCRPPRYYDELYSAAHEVAFADIKRKRVGKIAARRSEFTEDRLRVKEKVCKARVSLKARVFESTGR